MFGEGLEPVYECKMNNWRHNTAILWENDVKCHNEGMGVWGELKGDYVKVIEDQDNKRVKRKEDPRLQNCLAKGHIVTKRKMWSLIPNSPASLAPAYTHERWIQISYWRDQISSLPRYIASWSVRAGLRWLKAQCPQTNSLPQTIWPSMRAQ